MTDGIQRLRELEVEINAKIETRQDNKMFMERIREIHKRDPQNARETIFAQVNNIDNANPNKSLAILNENSQVVRLYINGTQLLEIPSIIFQFNNLIFLLFHDNNRIEKIPQEIASLTNLECLVINYNRQLRSIPQKLTNLPRLRSITIKGCEALSSPPREIAEQGLGAIFNYFISVKETKGLDYLYKAKMVLVGRGFAGKTSLVRKLTDPGYNLEKELKSTEGIAIDTWDLVHRRLQKIHIPISDRRANPRNSAHCVDCPNASSEGASALDMPLRRSDVFRFNIWDFGGQEKYDATHQLFITERTLYLFVTEARQESNYLDFDYWLNIVNMLGKNSPVIVVQNKIDQRQRSVPTERYRAQFPNIVGFANVSCADGYEETISQLKEVIRQAVSRLPQVGDELPVEWVTIRHDLTKLSVDHISYDEYREICAERGLSAERADFLSRYFHDLGVIVHQPRDPLLKKTVIVNPNWAVDGVYSVLDTRSIEERHGRFNEQDLEAIWSDDKYVDKHPELLALMKSYKLCFELPDTGTYIAPELLDADAIKYRPIKKKERLTFINRYEFMPAGLITRLIVKLHYHIEGEHFWRHGLVVKYEDARAAITEDVATNQIRINIEGSGHRKRELLAIIRKEFSDIYREFNRRIVFEELVPCICEHCQALIEEDLEPHYFDWRTVQRYVSKGVPMIRCGGESLAEVNVACLMGEIADKPDASGEFDSAVPSALARSEDSSSSCSRYPGMPTGLAEPANGW